MNSDNAPNCTKCYIKTELVTRDYGNHWKCSCSVLNLNTNITCTVCKKLNPTKLEKLEKLTSEISWKCVCGAMNKDATTQCLLCYRNKHDSGNYPHIFKDTHTNINQDTTWKCECGTVNTNYKSYCSKCFKYHTVSSENKVNEKTPNYWQCGCGALNLTEKTTCVKCYKYKGDSIHNQWKCSCGVMNQDSNIMCRSCGRMKNTHSQNKDAQTYCKCQYCSTFNLNTNIACSKCYRVLRKEEPEFKPTDYWTCSCSTLNLKYRNDCTSCGKLRFNGATDTINSQKSDPTTSYIWDMLSAALTEYNNSKPNTSNNNSNSVNNNNSNSVNNNNSNSANNNKNNNSNNTNSTITTNPPQNNDNEDNNVCIVCLDKPKQYAIIKCGHLCYCDTCGLTIKSCPICRKEYDPKNDLLKIINS
jgi:hypothetical protein